MKTRPPSSKANAGSVLIVVLVVCLGLVSLTLLFGHSMLMSYRGTDNELAARQADQAIDGAARYAEELIDNLETPGSFPDPATYTNEAVPVGDSYFWLIGRPTNTDPTDQPVFGLVDEAAKLNINTATLEMLEALPNMTAEFAAAIIDWRDVDETPTSGGAESETYLLRKPAYGAKNAPFESIEELALVNGATLDLLYGEDSNLNGVLDPQENDGSKTPPNDNSDGKLDPGVLEYLTTFTREPNKRADGTARVNVRNAVQSATQSLTALLNASLGPARAQQITQNVRNSATRGDFANLQAPTPQSLEILQAVYEAPNGGGSQDVTGILRARVRNNTLNMSVDNGAFGDPAVGILKHLVLTYVLDGKQSTITVEEYGILRLPGIQIQSVLEFFARSGMTEDEFESIGNDLTVSTANFVIGLVNANTASQTVLACIPGIGADKAQQLVAGRATRATPAKSVAWLAPLLADASAIRSAGPYLTAQSWQVTADVAAVGRHGRGYRRTAFVIDNTGDTPKIVYRRNLAPLGWALGDQVRQTLASNDTIR